jgi:hypothetical protein
MILRRLKLLSDVESAYIAGLIDGDGCLYMSPQTNTKDSYRLLIKVTCKEKNIVEWLYVTTGVGHLRQQKSYSSHQNGSVYWRWEITSHKDVVDLVEKIYPYTITKKRRCELFYHLGMNMQNKSTHSLTTEQRDWRKAIYDEFRSLQSHHITTNGGEFGGSLSEVIPSQADPSNEIESEGVEVRPEITAISALPDREDMTRAMERSIEVEWI